MSWSLSAKAPKAEARDAFVKVHQAQGAYSVDGSHKSLMDECAEFAAKAAEASPDGSEVSISSYGHFNTDGTGSATVSVNIGKAIAET
jgi:hypothetical protein